MKRFKTISATFIIIIAVIFACNVCYLVNLYESIRSTVERDVKSALADADLDELWIRAERANRETRSKIASGEQEPGSERRGGNISHTGLGRKHDLSHPLPRRLSGNRQHLDR